MTTYLGVGAGGGLELLRLRLARRAAELLPDVDQDARVPVLGRVRVRVRVRVRGRG